MADIDQRTVQRHTVLILEDNDQFLASAGRSFCMIAQSVARSRYLALGGFYRRLSGRHGGKVAIVAAARKLAVLYVRRAGLEQYQTQYKAQSLKRLQKAARVFGMQLTPSF